MRTVLILIYLTLATLSGNAISAEETRIPITFSASTYNEIANEYLERPTFAILNTRKKGKSWLDVSMERYGKSEYGNAYINNSFTQEHCDQYIAFIDKYLEWETIATRDGDMIDKKIGKAKNINMGLNFGFYSASSKAHFLIIGYSLDHGQYFSKENAIALKDLLLRYKNNELKPVNTESKYQ